MGRVFQEFHSDLGIQMRQVVKAPTQLSWEGWGECVYSATLVELGYQGLCVELEYDPFLDLAALSQGKPILGFLLVQPWQGCEAQSLLAQVREIDFVGEGVGEGPIDGGKKPNRKVILELIIPDSLRRIQNIKIKQLLQAFSVL